MSYYLIFNSQNEMNLKNIKEECVEQKWIAVASYENQNTSTIIYFNTFSTAKDFVRRNFKTNDMIGLISIPDIEFEEIKEKHKLECFPFPRKINQINIEIIQIKTELEIQVNYKRVC